MSGSALDVDKIAALLDGPDKASKSSSTASVTEDKKGPAPSTRDRDRDNGRRARSRGRHDPAARGDNYISLNEESDKAVDKSRYRKRSHSRDDDRYRSRRDGGYGDRYRSGRGRSRSPDGERIYRTPARRDDPRRYRERNDYRDYRNDRNDRNDRDDRRHDGRGGGGGGGGGGRYHHGGAVAQPTDHADQRAVFVQQLGSRVRSGEVVQFFNDHDVPARSCNLILDRDRKSKGAGYVELVSIDDMQKAIDLTGQRIGNIPIIVSPAEAEKNRAAAAAPSAPGKNNVHDPQVYKKLHVGNIHFSITEADLRAVFEPFGAIEHAVVEKDGANGRSKGFGFVQFVEIEEAKAALSDMNGFMLAGRPIRVGLGGDRFTEQSTNNILKSQPPSHANSSGAGGRGDRAAGPSSRDAGAATALDDSDVHGMSSHTRDALMHKLLRKEDGLTELNGQPAFKSHTPAAPSNPVRASPCVRLNNMFTASEAQGGPQWAKTLEDEISEECEDKYGKVVHISVDVNSSEGVVYVKFDREQGGENAMNGLNGRWFGGQRINAQLVPTALYRSLFPKSN